MGPNVTNVTDRFFQTQTEFPKASGRPRLQVSEFLPWVLCNNTLGIFELRFRKLKLKPSPAHPTAN